MQCLKGIKSADFLLALTSFLVLFATGRLPQESAQWLCACRLIPIGKKQGGIRPIAVGEVLRRSVAKCLPAQAPESMSSYLTPEQLGVAVPNGGEAIVHKVRQWRCQAGPTDGIVQGDF